MASLVSTYSNKRSLALIDSKQLTEVMRDKLFDDIKSMEYTKLGYFTSVLMADYLSNTMLAEHDKGGKNLNAISHETALDLIRQVKSLGVNVRKVILDTVGSPEYYRRWLIG